MSTYGYWIICRTCRFPIRMPRTPGRHSPSRSKGPPPHLVLACPVCGHVHKYTTSHFERVAFHIPDPFRNHRAILYSIAFPCAISACPNWATIFAIGAEDVSVALLLTLWRHWSIHVRCPQHHFLKPAAVVYWTISRVAQRRSPAV